MSLNVFLSAYWWFHRRFADDYAAFDANFFGKN